MPPQPAEVWDSRLEDLDGHLLQSWRWGAFKQRHGWHAHRILVNDPAGTAMAQVLYRFRGPVSLGYVPLERADHPDHFQHSVEAHAEFIGAAISALGIQRAHLVMNDIGGTPSYDFLIHRWVASLADEAR